MFAFKMAIWEVIPCKKPDFQAHHRKSLGNRHPQRGFSPTRDRAMVHPWLSPWRLRPCQNACLSYLLVRAGKPGFHLAASDSEIQPTLWEDEPDSNWNLDEIWWNETTKQLLVGTTQWIGSDFGVGHSHRRGLCQGVELMGDTIDLDGALFEVPWCHLEIRDCCEDHWSNWITGKNVTGISWNVVGLYITTYSPYSDIGCLILKRHYTD